MSGFVRAALRPAVVDFADAVGGDGPVAVEGGRTRWRTGGELAAGTRLVRAPAGIVEFQPQEMTVTVGAGTTVADLHAVLADGGQRTALPERPGATVGGTLMVGESSAHRLGRGHIRDALLQAVYVGSGGEIVTAGGPTVKNVSGFDLCRLLVGSLGTLGLVAEVILRTRPIPPSEAWFTASGVEPWALPRRLLGASAVWWDGDRTWVHVEGHAGDVAAQGDELVAGGFAPVDGPPPLPDRRWSLAPADLAGLDGVATGPFVAEVGVGTVHATAAPPPPSVDATVARLNAAMKQNFDPLGRLNPGRSVVPPAAA